MNFETPWKEIGLKELLLVGGMILLLMTGVLVAGTYVWIAGGADWEVYTNWSCTGSCGAPYYPDSVTDDALVTTAAIFIWIDDDHSIDDLTLDGMDALAAFNTDQETPPTITCEMIEMTDSNVSVWNYVTIVAED